MGRRLVLILFLILGAVAASMVGCGSTIREGEVVSKEFVPEHEISVPVYDMDFNFKGFENETVDDAWYITFKKYDENDELKTRTVEVSKNTYNSYEVGDWFIYK